MKIQHVFSYNDYTEEQKVKLAAAEVENCSNKELIQQFQLELDQHIQEGGRQLV